MPFSPDEQNACLRLAQAALAEDLDAGSDLTSEALLAPEARGQALLVSRGAGVLAGLPALEVLLTLWPAAPRWQPAKQDGERLRAGDPVGTFEGNLRAILGIERTALNFLQHLSGIATLTRKFVDAVAGLPVQILDTRKTLPGWRALAKYAVRQGGGTNHRLGLYDGFLIKDNHLAGLRIADLGLQIEEAVTRARRKNDELTRAGGPRLPIEIEVDRLEQLDAALRHRPDIVLLDNMGPDQLREAVARRNRLAPGVLLEASGGISLENVRGIAEGGVDRISVGALTHSAPALDLALDYTCRR